MTEFKRFFKRGLAALAPTLLTLALLVWAYRFIDQNIGSYITRLVVNMYAWGGPPHTGLGIDKEATLTYGDPIDEWDPNVSGRRLTVQYKAVTNEALSSPDEKIRREAQKAERDALWDIATRKWRFFNAIGFVIAIALIYFVGYFLASFVGSKTWPFVESVLLRVPIIKAIYPNIKQVTDLLISDQKLEFAGVVAVQYPRKGIWSLGLVTGKAMRAMREADSRDLLTVFVPSSPTPFTGYTITVSREDIIELDLSIDEALRYTVSGGVLTPGEHTTTVPREPNANVLPKA